MTTLIETGGDSASRAGRKRWTLALVCTAAFMLLLDITVVSVALPSIQRDLHASLPDLQWVSAAYALVLAVLLLPAATLHQLVGLPASPGAVHQLAAAVASGAGARVAASVPPAARAAVTQAARAGTASGLNSVLLAAAAFAALGEIVGFAYGPDPARQPPPRPTFDELPAQAVPVQHQAKRLAKPETTAP